MYLLDSETEHLLGTLHLCCLLSGHVTLGTQ